MGGVLIRTLPKDVSGVSLMSMTLMTRPLRLATSSFQALWPLSSGAARPRPPPGRRAVTNSASNQNTCVCFLPLVAVRQVTGSFCKMGPSKACEGSSPALCRPSLWIQVSEPRPWARPALTLPLALLDTQNLLLTFISWAEFPLSERLHEPFLFFLILEICLLT